MPRLFIAVQPDEEVLTAAWNRLEPYRAKSPSSVRWVSCVHLHFTLKFLGNVSEETAAFVPGAIERVAKIAGPPFLVFLAGIGAFPSAFRPSVFWIGAGDGAKELCRIAEALEAELASLGFSRESRPFHPHLTIARVPGRAAVNPGVRHFFEKLKRDPGGFGTFRARELVLFESVTLPSGSVYRERFKATLERTLA